MSIIQNSATIVINSKDRNNGTNSDFSYTIPDIFQKQKFEYVCLLSALIPKSYYLVPQNSTFTLDEDGSQVIITVPEGNYTRSTFSSKIATLLNTNSPNNWSYSIDYALSNDTQTGKYTYNITGNGGLPASLIFTDKLYEQFGFNENSSNTFTSSLESDNVIKMQRENAILILCDLTENINEGNQVIGSIFGQDYPYLTSIQYEMNGDLEAKSKKIKEGVINNIHIKITDENFNVLDMNGQNSVFILLFWSPRPIYKKISGYINYLLAKEIENNE